MKSLLVMLGILTAKANAGVGLINNNASEKSNSNINYSHFVPKEEGGRIVYMPVGFTNETPLGLVSWENRVSLLGSTRNFITFLHNFVIPQNGKLLEISNNILSSNQTKYAYGIYPELDKIYFDLYNNYQNITWNYEDYYTEHVIGTDNHIMYWTMGYTNNVTNEETDFVIRSQHIPEDILVSEGLDMDVLVSYQIE